MWIELKLKKKHKAKQTMKNEDNRSFQTTHNYGGGTLNASLNNGH